MTNNPEAVEVTLLPCPFCGGEPERITISAEDEPNNAGGDVITCLKCGASSHVEFGRKENLVSHWNTRLTHSPVSDVGDGELADRLEQRLADIVAKSPLANTLPLVEKEIGVVLAALRSQPAGGDAFYQIRQIIAKIFKQSECLEGYAENHGHEAKPVPSVFHLQAAHFRTYANEMEAEIERFSTPSTSIRESTLEEAAKLCDDKAYDSSVNCKSYDERETRAFWRGAEWMAEKARDAIRNLKPKPEQEAG